MMKPAAVRATAPVSRFAVCDSLGKAEEEEEEELLLLPASAAAGPRRATSWRSAFRDVKYKADPKPVRRADGSVPRHNERIGFGEEMMARTVAESEAVRVDCWTRVLSRSAGWRRIEEVRPEASPARKWNVVLDAVKF